jgi:tRNA pseudouridine55 synthase
VRDIQRAFNESAYFAPWLETEKARRAAENRFQKQRRRHKRIDVKVGHGGTLDPLATGVLVIGVGKGTKSLQDFLHCTKAYDTSVVFGAATDTYDILGKVVGRAEYGGITREKVDGVLGKFKGDIMQRPPIFSALRIDGKRLYEYAREGKELPREIQERPVRVEELVLKEWFGPGAHEFKIPDEKAPSEEIELAEKVLELPVNTREAGDLGSKRKRENTEDKDNDIEASGPVPKERRESSQQPGQDSEITAINDVELSEQLTTAVRANSSTTDANGPPAARLVMTVTSGFYVRSLCHDLGKILGSLSFMGSLIRTRQGDFELGKNVLSYEDLKDEKVWAPKLKVMLQDWQARHAPNKSPNRPRQHSPNRQKRRNSSSEAED